MNNYSMIIIPLIATVIAQGSKFFIKSNHQRFSWRSLFAYSGMPSGHSAMVISLATIIGLREGFSSAMFALSAVFAVLVIRDAVGLRRYLGEHGKMLNELARDLKKEKVLAEHFPHLLERVGHTPLQVLVGGTIGFVVSVIGYLIIR